MSIPRMLILLEVRGLGGSRWEAVLRGSNSVLRIHSTVAGGPVLMKKLQSCG